MMKKTIQKTLSLLLVAVFIFASAPLETIGAFSERESFHPILQKVQSLFDGLSIRADAATCVTITSLGSNTWFSSDTREKIAWTSSSSEVTCYRYSLIRYVIENGAEKTVETLEYKKLIHSTSFSLGDYALEPSSCYKVWVGAFTGSGDDDILLGDSGAIGYFKTEPDPPEVTTLSATGVSGSSATLRGVVDKNNGENITLCGFAYGETSTSSSLVKNGSSCTTVITGDTGALSDYTFSKSITGLEPGTTYYYRAFAENKVGISYGARKSFTTTEIVTDRPGDFSFKTPEQGASIAYGSVTVTWTAASQAAGYKIAMRDMTDDIKILDNVDIGSTLSYTIAKSKLTMGHRYTLALCAYNEIGDRWIEGQEFSVTVSETSAAITSVKASPENAIAGTEFTFTVTANKYTSKVGVEIDGNSIGTATSYTTSGTSRIFTLKHIVTSPGENRNVIAYPYDSSTKLTVGTASTCIHVYDAPAAGVPVITSPADGSAVPAATALTVKWKAPVTKPDSYNVYVYRGSSKISEKNVTTTEYTIKATSLLTTGNYAVEVYAVKSGHKADDPAIVDFTVKSSSLPTVTAASASASEIAVNETVSFTVQTSKTAETLYMLTEDGGVAQTWSADEFSALSGTKRIWNISKTMYSPGVRTLSFCAGAGGVMNSESRQSVQITVTASADLSVTASITSNKNATLTQGESYRVTWTADEAANSYNVLVYQSGNLIFTKKNITSNSYTIESVILAQADEYSVEVYPILAGYKSVCDAARITVKAQTAASAEIISVSASTSVIKDTDLFLCNVQTNTAAVKAEIIYETGGTLEMEYKYTSGDQKFWQLSKKLDTIGVRKMRVVVFDASGNASEPYPFTVSVRPREIPWDMQYNYETGDLTISATAEQVDDMLDAGYAKIVIYENGFSKDLVPEFNAQTIINHAGTYSKTWNVFTDFGLESGQPYEIAVGYISTLVNYYGGQDRLVVVKNNFIITPEYVDVPVVYSVEIEEDSEEVSAQGDTPKKIQKSLGEETTFTVTTSVNATKIYMIASDSKNTKNDLIDLTILNGTTSRIVYDKGLPYQKVKEWTVRKEFTGLHCNRQVRFLCSYYDTKTETLKCSNVKSAPDILLIQFPLYSWSGRYDNGTLTVYQTDKGLPKYNDANIYSLWIKNTKTGKLDYYYNDVNTELKRQDVSGCLVRSWDVASELYLEEGTTYAFGVRGKSVYADADGSVSSVDLQLGTFTCNTTNEAVYGYRGIAQDGVPVFRSAYNKDYLYQNGERVTLRKDEVIEVKTSNLDNQTASEEWVQIRCNGQIAYVQRKYVTAVRFATKSEVQSQLVQDLYQGGGKLSYDFDGYVKLKDRYGYRHEGIDFGKYSGAPVYSLISGKVTRAGGGDFNTVAIYDSTNDKTVVYLHLGTVITENVKVGEEVTKGTLIGKEGNTGTGEVHTHVEVCKGKVTSAEISKNKDLSNDDPYPYWSLVLLNKPLENQSAKRMTKSVSGNPSCIARCVLSNGNTVEVASTDGKLVVPFSTAYISFIVYPDVIPNQLCISYDGAQLSDYEYKQFTPGSSLIVQADESISTISIERRPSESNLDLTGIFLAGLMGEDNNISIDLLSVSKNVQTNNTVVIPKKIKNICLNAIPSSPFSNVQIFRDSMPIVDPSYMLIDETEDTDIRIVVTADSGDQKEYTLTIHKKQTLESDNGLQAFMVAKYENEECTEYTDCLNTSVISMPEGTKVVLSDYPSSAFAQSTIFVDGVEYTGGLITVSGSKQVKVVVVAEDGTQKAYVYTLQATVETYTATWIADGVRTEQQVVSGQPLTKPADPVKEGYTFTGWSPAVPEVMPAHDVSFTATFAVNEYNVTWSIDGSTTNDTYTFGAAIRMPADPIKPGYTFTGWTPSVPATMPARDLTFIAVFEPILLPTVAIHNYVPSRTEDYRTTITFSADLTNAVSGAQVHWIVDGKNVGTGDSYTVKEAKKSFNVQVKYVKDGEVLAESEIETVTVKSGFLDKVKAFFRSLFRRLPVIVQEYLGVEIIDRTLP